MKTALRALCVLLVFTLLAALACPAFAAGAEPSAPLPEGFADCVEGQVFAASMACWMNGVSRADAPFEQLLQWDMAGWYAARLHRVNDWDLLGEAQVLDFLGSVGLTGEPRLPDGWSETGVVRVLRGSDGSAGYDFARHKNEFDSLMGVSTEVFFSVWPGLRAEGTVVSHYDNGTQVKHVFSLRFEENDRPDSAFRYRLIAVEAVEQAPELIGDLSFTWDELIRANKLRHVLSLYPAVSSRCEEYASDVTTWAFVRGDSPALVSCGDGFVNGRYRGCVFEVSTWETEEPRVMISEFREDAGSWDTLDDFLINRFDRLLEMRFDCIEDDLIWTDCTFEGGMRQRIAFDRGTLVLRRIDLWYSSEYPPVTTEFGYRSPAPDLPFLDGWSRPLRTVTLIWEDMNSDPPRWTETRQVPADWEYLPYVGRWGDYAVWMDRGYTQPYAYPGPDVDYFLYLSTAKG